MKLDKAKETNVNCPEFNYSLVRGIVLSMMSFEFYLKFGERCR